MSRIKEIRSGLLLLCMLFVGSYQLAAQQTSNNEASTENVEVSLTEQAGTQVQTADGQTKSTYTLPSKEARLKQYRAELKTAQLNLQSIKQAATANANDPDQQKALKKADAKVKLLQKRIKDLTR